MKYLTFFTLGWVCFFGSMLSESALPYGLPLTVGALTFWLLDYKLIKRQESEYLK